MYKRVLLAYDGSECGRKALLQAADVNHLLQAELHLLAVAPLMAGLYITEGFVPDSLQEEENRRYGQILEDGLQLLREKSTRAQGHLVTGEPVDEICRLAAEISADLIVVGHRRHQNLLARWWKGSVGASMIENAPCSVLIVIEN